MMIPTKMASRAICTHWSSQFLHSPSVTAGSVRDTLPPLELKLDPTLALSQLQALPLSSESMEFRMIRFV